MGSSRQIRTAQSCAREAQQAVMELYAGIAQDEMALVVFFCSSRYDRDVLATEMNRQFAGVQVVGCTTAGEIGPLGYCEDGLVGVSFPAATCAAVSGRLDRLQQFEIKQGLNLAQQMLGELESVAPVVNTDNTFAFLLIDGLSKREEPVAHALQNALGDISLFGGSAGDDLRLEHTWVFHDGAFHSDSAVLLLISTELPFRIFKTQHFVSESERLVVTAADASRRLVKEINCLPAADEYARIVGTTAGSLDPSRFAARPVVVAIDGTDYVRSIQKANADGSLTFYCAIEEGLVLRVVRGVDLLGNLQETFDTLRSEIGPLQFVFACDCILRSLEVRQAGLQKEVAQIFRDNHAIGFSTYGEQFHGVHVNQTLSGIAIGNMETSDA
ncbi:FIST C-terminal domain-containing protein [Dechloromonas sp. XY25]|uniref:FIST C-terminal domain-containing protein n=1 Tax=Dechloromonas hankyongensis TaxID=2908002 RepID=A0ABS9K789_9RHOO|nr:nitric oxide-sensing protein NosP [Dechloromonas hankyongensis]MCG2579022.1 FIST C-terminal domain-containing protein [Dechloromonas hankyongensis]